MDWRHGIWLMGVLSRVGIVDGEEDKFSNLSVGLTLSTFLTG
jgi:hypothetical protein